jgi:hypothetical protein
MGDCCNVERPAVSAPASEVTVLFDDMTVTFPIPAATTWADLAQHLAREAGSSRRRMVSVAVKVESSTGPGVRLLH